MRQTKIEIPIYRCELTLILDDNLDEVEKIYGLPSLKDFGAVTFKEDNKYRAYVSAFTDATHLSNIAHEIVHLKNQIYIDCAMQVDRHNDEPEAYLTGWLFDQIHDFLTDEKSD